MKSPIGNLLQGRLAMVALIILLGFTAYSFMLGGNFKQLDDQVSVVNSEDIKSFAHIGQIFRKPFFEDRYYYRPLVSLSYMGEYHFFGLNPFFYNLTNLCLHLMIGISVFFIMGYIFRDNLISFFVSLLYVIHPIQWEAVSNIAGRAIVLCAFFYINAFLCYCLFKSQPKRKIYLGLSMALFVFSLLCKETAVTFPILLVSFEFFFKENPPKFSAASWQRILPFFMIVFSYLLLRRVLGIDMFHWRNPQEMILGVITFLRAAITYLRLFVLPTGLYFDRARPLFEDFHSGGLWFTLLFFIVLFSFLFTFRKKLSKEFLFFVSWFFIELLPVAQIIPIGIQFGYISTAEHFLYIASAGIFVGMVLAMRWFYQKGISRGLFSKEIFQAAVVGLFVFLFLITIQQNIYASNEMAMLKESVRYNKTNVRVQSVLGLSLARKRLFKEAEESFRNALAAEPFDAGARIGLGKALCDQGRYFEGISEYEKVTYAGKYAQLLQNNLRLTYGLLINQYKSLIQKNPANAKLYYSLGVAYSKNKNTPEAMKQYGRAIELDPNLKDAIFNLASSYESLGKLYDAASYYERTVTLEGSDKYLDYYAYVHLGMIYDKLGDTDKSKKYFEESQKIKPKAGGNSKSYMTNINQR